MDSTIFTNVLFEHYQTIVLIAIIATFLYLKPQKNLPPGPCGLPIVGYLPFLKQPAHIGITELGKKYGNVMSYYSGRELVIVLGDYGAIKEAFVKQGNIFSGKPKANAFKFKKTDKGIMMAEGETASQHRRFITSSLRDFGMGTTNLEQRIMKEIKSFLDVLSKENGKAVDIQNSLQLSVSNVIATFEFGKPFEQDDEEFAQLRNAVRNNSKFNGVTATRIFFPWIKYLPFTDEYTGFQKTKNSADFIRNFNSNKVLENERNYIEGSRTHYVDAYLTNRNLILQKTGSEGWFGKAELLGNLRALFIAGTETSYGILLWSILYLLKYPEKGKKMLKEIDDVIGHNRDPTFSDKSNMPYTEAYMLEVLRHSSIVPFTLIHSNIVKTTLYGFNIPDHSHVIGNLWAVHNDKDLWENPDKFNPERFINKQGKVERPEYLIPFSIGKRNCIGEPLANITYFLYFVTLLQKFDIKVPHGETLSIEPTVGIALSPKPFKICAVTK